MVYLVFMRPQPQRPKRSAARRNLAKTRDGHVRRRIIALFIAGVAMPSGLLGYLALRGVRNDEALFEREQREALEEDAARVLRSFEGRLAGLARRAVSSDSPALLEAPVDAVFDLTPEGEFRGLASSKGLYTADTPSGPDPDAEMSASDELRLGDAQRRELRDGDLEGASTAYSQLLSETKSPRGQAEALNGIARVARKHRRLDEAAERYRQLIGEYGALRSGSGIPFGLAGRLELLVLLEGSPDVDAAAKVSAALLQALLRAEYRLTKTEYDFVADKARHAAQALAERPDDLGHSGPWPDSLRALLAREEIERARSTRILGFVSTATEQPDLLSSLTEPGRALGPQHAMLRGEGGPYPVYVPAVDVAKDQPEAPARGLLLDPLHVEQMAEEAVRGVARSEDLRWVLRDEAGATRAASEDGAEGQPIVLTAFPQGFPPLVLGLLPPTSGGFESFFASPRSLYLYALVLVVGILAGGVALTVRTISHQLELARMQSDFVSTVSHELKSPVTSIRQLAEMLQTGRVPSEERRQRYFDVLAQQSERLTAVIDHVLDFARWEAGQTELDLVEVDLERFLSNVIAGAQAGVRHQGFVVRGEIDSDLPRVTLDPEAIALAVSNVIDNAIKYSGDSREVVVAVSADDDHAMIAVQDFGIGLEPEDQDRVFERFYRGGEALTRSVKGTGLGLTLVKQIVEAHGGSIVVDSEPGRGSTFTIRLPVSGP